MASSTWGSVKQHWWCDAMRSDCILLNTPADSIKGTLRPAVLRAYHSARSSGFNQMKWEDGNTPRVLASIRRAFNVFEERAQAKDRKQRAFMRFQLGQCINSLAQLLDELFACAQDIQLTAYNQLMFFDPFFWMPG